MSGERVERTCATCGHPSCPEHETCKPMDCPIWVTRVKKNRPCVSETLGMDCRRCAVWVLFTSADGKKFRPASAHTTRKQATEAFRWSIAYRKGRPRDLARIVRTEVPVPVGRKP